MTFIESASPLLWKPHIADQLADRILLCTLQFKFSSSQSPSMAPRKPRKTKNSAKSNPPETAPKADPQDNCPLFKLPPELRDMIYTYVFAPGQECSSDSSVAVAALGNRYYKRAPSGVLLRTCRLINTDAAKTFAKAMRNSILVIDLSSAESRGNSAVDETNPFPGLNVPRLSDDQMSQLKRFTVIVHTKDTPMRLLPFHEQLLPCGTPYWVREDIEAIGWYLDEIEESHVARSLVPGARKLRMLKRKQFDKIMRDAIANMRLAKEREARARDRYML